MSITNTLCCESYTTQSYLTAELLGRIMGMWWDTGNDVNVWRGGGEACVQTNVSVMYLRLLIGE